MEIFTSLSRVVLLLLIGWVQVALSGRSRPWCVGGVGICRSSSALAKYDHAMAVLHDSAIGTLKAYVVGGALQSGLVQRATFVEEINLETRIASTLSTTGTPEPRSGHSVVLRENGQGVIELIVFGGLATEGTKTTGLNDVHLLNLETKSWTQLFSDPGDGTAPEARSHHGAALLGNRMVIWGGKNSSGTILDDLFYFDTQTLKWTGPVTPSGTAPSSRYASSMYPLEDDTVIMYGGRDGDAAGRLMNDMHILLWPKEDDTPKWITVSFVPEPDIQTNEPDWELLLPKGWDSAIDYVEVPTGEEGETTPTLVLTVAGGSRDPSFSEQDETKWRQWMIHYGFSSFTEVMAQARSGASEVEATFTIGSFYAMSGDPSHVNCDGSSFSTVLGDRREPYISTAKPEFVRSTQIVQKESITLMVGGMQAEQGSSKVKASSHTYYVDLADEAIMTLLDISMKPSTVSSSSDVYLSSMIMATESIDPDDPAAWRSSSCLVMFGTGGKFSGSEPAFDQVNCANPFYMTASQNCKEGANCNLASMSGYFPDKRIKYSSVGFKDRAIFMYGGQYTEGGAAALDFIQGTQYKSVFGDLFDQCLLEANSGGGDLSTTEQDYLSACLENMLVDLGYVSTWYVDEYDYTADTTSEESTPSPEESPARRRLLSELGGSYLDTLNTAIDMMRKCGNTDVACRKRASEFVESIFPDDNQPGPPPRNHNRVLQATGDQALPPGGSEEIGVAPGSEPAGAGAPTVTPVVEIFMDDAWVLRYNPGNIGEQSDSFAWQECTLATESDYIGPLSGAGMVAIGDKSAILFGGAREDGLSNEMFNVTWIDDDPNVCTYSAKVILPESDMVPSPRRGHSMAFIAPDASTSDLGFTEGILTMFGGSTDPTLSDHKLLLLSGYKEVICFLYISGWISSNGDPLPVLAKDLLIVPVAPPTVIDPQQVPELRRLLSDMYDGDILAIDVDHGDLLLDAPIELSIGVTMRAFSASANTRAVGRTLKSDPMGTIGCSGDNHAVIVKSTGVRLEGFDVKGCTNSAILIDTPNVVTEGEGVTLSRMTFSDNDAEYGAAIYIQSQANVTLSNITFDSNTASVGSAVYVAPGGLLYEVKDSLFQNNNNSSNHAPVTSGPSSSALVVDEGGCLNRITDSTFLENAASIDGGGMYIKTPSCSVELNEAVFANNSASESGGGFAIDNLRGFSLLMTNCTVEGNKASEGGGISLVEFYLPVTLRSSSIVGNEALSRVGGGIKVLEGDQVDLHDMQIRRNVAATKGGGISYDKSGTLNIYGSTLAKNTATAGGAIFSGQDLITNIFNSRISQNKAVDGGGWQCETCDASNVTNTRFIDNIALSGGAISLMKAYGLTHIGDSVLSGNVALLDSNWIASKQTRLMRSVECSYEGGGAICAQIDSDVNIVSNQILDNTAKNGGGLFVEHTCEFSGEEAATCGVVRVDNSTIGNNVANGGGGGAVHFKEEEGLLFLCDAHVLDFTHLQRAALLHVMPCDAWIDNRAINNGYGPQVATGGTYLALHTGDHIEGYNSGDIINVDLSIQDAYNQTITGGLPEAQTIISINSPDNVAQGQTSVSTILGDASFDTLKVSARSGTYNLEFIPEGLDSLDSANVIVDVRPCLLGEVHECPNSKACTTDNRTAQLQIFQGHVRLANDWSLEEYRGTLCADGYTGNLCAVCMDGYGSQGDSECAQCPNKILNNLYYVLQSLINVVLIAVTVRSQLKSQAGSPSDAQEDAEDMVNPSDPSFTSTGTKKVRKNKGNHSTVIKIMVSYLQVVSLVKEVDLNWPGFLAKYFSASSQASAALGQMVSIDCSLSKGNFPISIQRTLIFVFMPVYLTAAAAIFWWFAFFLYGRRKDKSARLGEWFKSRFIVTVISIIFFTYPGITDILLSFFSCPQLDDGRVANPYFANTRSSGRFWSEDYDMKCYEGSHLFLVLAIGLPGIVLFSLGVPLWSALFLRRHKEKLHDEAFLGSYGFLYEEYEDEFYYWESFIMLRKFLVVTVLVFLSSIGLELQLLAALGVVILAMVLQVIYNPYELWQMDILERLSLYATAFTLYIAMFYMINNISYTVKILLSLVLLFANVAVLAYFLVNIFREFIFGTVSKIDFQKRQLIEQKLGKTGTRLLKFVETVRDLRQKVHGTDSEADEYLSPAERNRKLEEAYAQKVIGKNQVHPKRSTDTSEMGAPVGASEIEVLHDAAPSTGATTPQITANPVFTDDVP
ncbi:hypothetical protein BSKO_00033 [Bryopsis sp. KO-2023]|nr:hypothetical protein BSKO_00033 [Bryopsis sp. KO-2023]